MMHRLSGETVRLISSAQVITSISSVVKELVENSLDAHADNIEVKLENFGVDKVEVRDNGDGIPPSDATVMAQRHFTSKISRHEDLESLLTYGFRGEALGSLCAVSSVVIATKTRDEEVGRCYTMTQEGEVASSKPFQCGTGTIITATRLFHNVPVRKQYYSSAKRRREELKKVEDLLLSFGVVCPGIRFSLSHNRSPIWQKNKAANLKSALLNTVGSSVMNQLVRVERSDTEAQVRIEGFLPKLDSDVQLTTRATDDRSWTSVNGRPVILKDVTKVIKQYFSQAHPKPGNVRHLVMCLAITVPTHLVDVNLEPNKTKVLLQNKDAVLSLVIQILDELYKPPPTKSDTPMEELPHLQFDGHGHTSSMGQSGQRESVLGKPHSDATTNSDAELRNSDRVVQDVPQTTFQCVGKDAADMEVRPDRQTTSEGLDVRLMPSEQDSGRKESERMTENEAEHMIMEPSLPNFSLLDFDGDLLATCPTVPDAVSRAPKVVGETTTSCRQESDTGNALPNDGRDSVLFIRNSSNTSDFASTVVKERTSPEARSVDQGEGTKNQGATEWSKGRGLSNQSGENIQPSVLLVPGKQTSTLLTSDRNQGQSIAHSDTRMEEVHLSVTSAQSLQTPSKEQDTCNVMPGQGNNGSNVQLLGGPDLTSDGHSMAGPNLANERTAGELSTNQRTAGELSTNQSPGKLKRHMEEKTSPGSQYDLVGKAPVKRPQDAFMFFVKEKKPDILRQHPNLDFMAVNRILRSQWEQLEGEEKERFEELQAKDLQRYRDQVVCAKHSLVSKKDPSGGLPAKKKKKMENLSNQSLINEMLASQRERKRQAAVADEQKSTECKRIEQRLPFSVSSLKRAPRPTMERPTDDGGSLRLVGSLPGHGIWLAIRGGHMTVFNQYRAQEVLLYHRLLANHRLPCQKLAVPIVLSSSMFGDEKNWFTLLGMRSQVTPVDQSRRFMDDRLLMNGFEIRQLVDPETRDARLEVVSMAMDILPFYGLDDLKEIVETVATQGAQKVMECRPLKLVNYLMGEAVRMARSLPAIMTEEEVTDIVEGIEGLTSWKSHLCLHGKSFEKEIYAIPNIHTS